MTALRLRPRSLRARITIVIVTAAILPLALIGAWLAASAARSGRELLRGELQESLVQITQRMQDRWQFRSADLELLANNEPARLLLAGGDVDPETARFFSEIGRTFTGSLRDFTYREAAGRVRWSSVDAVPVAPASQIEARRVAEGFSLSDALLVRRPVRDSRGAEIGAVEAHVLLSAILPTDSLPLIVAGAALRLWNRETGERVGGPAATAGGSAVVSVRASLAEPPLDVELAASDARYVQPFARAASFGLASLFAVALLAFALTTFFTRRLTAQLEQMAEAAGAVAAGDLDRSVAGAGEDEIGRLAAAFNSMTESLRRTLRDLARGESLAAVGQFAASISHEVRNALTSVRLDLQRLSERLAGDDQKALARRLLRNVQRLDSIVTGSLRIAKTDPATMRPLLAEGVVRAAMTAAEPAFVESGAKVVLEPVGTGGPRVRGDPAALEHLFINLLMNAAQAMTTGGVAAVTIQHCGESVRIRIADQGHGIAPEVLARMGEQFLTSRPEGTGLGFAIARQIAVAHGGEVNIVSSGPAGTTIDVVLPAVEL